MAFYATSTNTWGKRMAIGVRDSGGSGGAYDVTITLGPQHASFWDAVQSNGYDIVITQSDGLTVLNHQRAAWDSTARTATIEIESASLDRLASTPRLHLLWIYYDATTTVGSDPTSAFTASSPLDADAWPGKVRASQVITIPPPLPGDTQPRLVLQRAVDDEAQVLVSLAHLLDPAQTDINGSPRYDEPGWVELGGESGGSPASLWSLSRTRYDHDGNYLRTINLNGSSATDYLQYVRLAISNPDEPVDGSGADPAKVVDMRVIVKVYDTVET